MESSDTPSPAALPPAPPSLLPVPRSGLDSLLSKLPGTAVQLYALHQLQPTLLVSCADETRFRLGLLGFVVIVAPAAVWSAFDLARHFLSKRT